MLFKKFHNKLAPSEVTEFDSDVESLALWKLVADSGLDCYLRSEAELSLIHDRVRLLQLKLELVLVEDLDFEEAQGLR